MRDSETELALLTSRHNHLLVIGDHNGSDAVEGLLSPECHSLQGGPHGEGTWTHRNGKKCAVIIH